MKVGHRLISYGKVINKLCHFHIHDGRGNPPENHLALGDGDIDLTEHLGIAKACNARCVLETKTIEALKKSVEWVKNKVVIMNVTR